MVGTFTRDQFNQRVKQDISNTVINPTSDTLTIKYANNLYDDVLIQMGDLRIAGDALVSENVRVIVKKTEEPHFELIQEHYSRGANSEEANALVNSIQFPIEIKNNVITLPPNFVIKKGNKWRNQRVEVTLKVPVDKFVYLDKSLHWVNLEIDHDTDHPWFKQDQTWKMTDAGMIAPDYVKENNSDREFTSADFNEIHIDGKLKVNVTKGDQYKVNIRGRKVHTRKVEIFQFGNTLNVSTDIRNPSSPIYLDISMPSLQSLDMENTDDVKIRGFKESKMNLRFYGNNELKAYVDIDTLNVRQSGRNEIDIRGNGKHLKANLDNRSKLDAERFTVFSADIQTSERSTAKLSVSDFLKKRTDDSNSIKVEGEPVIDDGEALTDSGGENGN